MDHIDSDFNLEQGIIPFSKSSFLEISISLEILIANLSGFFTLQPSIWPKVYMYSNLQLPHKS